MENRDFLLFDNNSLWKGRICGLLSNSLPRPKDSTEGGARLHVCKRQGGV
jgi:hypothetical protein